MNSGTQNNHLKETIFLSLPIIATQLGHIVTGMVDTIFLGALGKTEQAAGILANNLFVLLLVFSIGMSYAVTPLISGAHVNTNSQEKASLFKNALVLNLGISLLLFLLLFIGSPLLKYMHQPADVVELATPFFNVIMCSIIPVSLFFVCKQYYEGLSNTKIAMFISLGGNILNIILNYCLIYGKFGLPTLGYMGSCWATFISRIVMGICFLFLILQTPTMKEWFNKVSVNITHVIALFKLGFGSALQFTFEVAAFIIAGLMAGSFGKEQIDAHGIALSLAAFTYMFGSGISSAATIRVGNFNAQKDYTNLKRAGNTAFSLVLGTMGCMTLLFILLHNYLPIIFSKDHEIITLSAELLIIAAFFQLFDGTQVTALGILRGLEDVKFPTFVTFIAYWGIALPLAYYFAFILNLKVQGIWYALSVSLVIVAVALYLRFKYLMKLKLSPSNT